MKVIKYLFVALLVSFPLLANAKKYEVDYKQSEIAFSGTHAGNQFEGVFETWEAVIEFDKENLDQSFVKVSFDTESAKTGNAMYDGTLPSKDWFDIKSYPEAIFNSRSFEKTNNGYKVTGDLKIKNITHPLAFEFQIDDNENTVMVAEFPVNRLDFEIGKGSDPSAEWVSENIIINLNIIAN